MTKIDIVYRGLRLQWPFEKGVLITVRRGDGRSSYGTVPVTKSSWEPAPDTVSDDHLRRVADTYLYIYAVSCNRPWDDLPWEIHLIDDPVARAVAEAAYRAERA